MATEQEIEQFLMILKEKLRVFGGAFRTRDKNRISLGELDILPDDRIDYIMNLRVEDYYTGPNKDGFDPGKPDYYEFGIKIGDKEVYIKISLGLPNKRVDCISFHKAEYPITYPFKDEKL